MRTIAQVVSVVLLAFGLVLTASAYLAVIGLPILMTGLFLQGYALAEPTRPAPSAVVAPRPPVAAARSERARQRVVLAASLVLVAFGLVLTASAYLAVIGLPILGGGLLLLAYAVSGPASLAPSH